MRKKPVRQSSRSVSRSSSHHSNAFGVALFVGSLILLLIFAAFIIKILLVFHQSSFDGKHQFVVAVNEPHTTQFVIFNPDVGSIKTLVVAGATASNPESAFSVPVDATAVADDTYASSSDLINSLVFNRKRMHATMTIIDAINLLIFSHTVSSDNQSSQAITVASLAEPDSLAAKVFLDNTLYKEGKSVAIVNATNVAGLGTTVGTLLMNMGGNVVSITTADNTSSTSSVVFTGDLSYTASRIAHILHMPLVHLSGVRISDITVTVGTDRTKYFH